MKIQFVDGKFRVIGEKSGEILGQFATEEEAVNFVVMQSDPFDLTPNEDEFEEVEFV